MPRTFATMAVILLMLAVAAFWPQYIGRPVADVDRYTHVHAAIGSSWLLLLIAQPLAIAARRFALHRALGRATYAIAPAFLVSAIALAHHRFAAMDEAAFAREAFSLYLPLFIAALFATAWWLGMRYRGEPRAHARFMACTGLLLIDPVLGRLMFHYLPALPTLWLYQLITFAATDLLIVALVASLPASAAGRPALTAYLIVVVASQALWFTFARSDAWIEFAAWFRGLPLT
jgi:hypothetical protein